MPNLNDLQKSPEAFRKVLLIDTDSGPKPLASVCDDWQKADFQALDSGWRRAAGQRPGGKVYSRAWLERPRGHAKTSDLAVMCLWALFAAKKRITGIGGAGDLEQARLLRDAIGRLIALNPWLGKLIEVQAYRVQNRRTGSMLEIISSDAPTSYGLLLDFCILDELVHWKKRDLWDSLLSSVAKRRTCLLVSITNAGMLADWQHQLRESVREDPNWYFHALQGPQASWIGPEALAEQERLLPPSAFRRLWHNEWASGGGDALAAEVIARAFRPDLRPMPEPLPGYEFCAGLDVGVSRDASALVVLGVRVGESYQDTAEHGRIRLCYIRAWIPHGGRKVNLQEIEDTLVALHHKYDFQSIAYDPWEARHLSQRLTLLKLPMHEITQTGSNLQKLATTLIEAMNDGRLDLYPNTLLEKQLRRLRVVERSYGFRLESPRDSSGHGDLASAFAYALLAASEIAGDPPGVVGAAWSNPAHEDLPGWAQNLLEREQELISIRDNPIPIESPNAPLQAFIYQRSGGLRANWPYEY